MAWNVVLSVMNVNGLIGELGPNATRVVHRTNTATGRDARCVMTGFPCTTVVVMKNNHAIRFASIMEYLRTSVNAKGGIMENVVNIVSINYV